MADLTAEEMEAAKLVAEAEKVKAEAEEKAKLKAEVEEVDHEHRWKRGILAGGKYVKSCFVDGCGKIEQIAFEEWQTISDR